MALDGLDKNGDGVYDPSELEPLTRENLDSLKDYNYFTYVRYDGKPQAIGTPIDAGQIYSEQQAAASLPGAAGDAARSHQGRVRAEDL